MAYAETTSVAFEKSVAEIVGLVRKAGAEQIGQMEDTTFFSIGFKLSERLIRFKVTFPTLDAMPQYDGNRRTLSKDQRQAKLDQRKRQLARALMLVIKAKLESVESGIETLEQAFLANVVTSNGETVYERVSAPLALEYQTGRPDLTCGLLPPPSAQA